MVPFSGWDMPVQYGSILDEARHVRAKCGLFDLCHMGRFRVTGSGAETALKRLVTNNVAKIKPGVIRYALLTKEDGGVLDDVLVYRDPERTEEFFVVVNAGNCDRDLEWMQTHAAPLGGTVTDHTSELAMIALQGPASESILNPHTGKDLAELGYYKWIHTRVFDIEVSVSRTGYTGEDGFEIYCPTKQAVRIWDALVETGADLGLLPIGLAARDTLRLEAGMALYGHELSESINPYEAGLGWAVKLKSGFIGAEVLAAVKENGPARQLVGLETTSRRVPRQDYPVIADGEQIGFVASGTFSPVRDCNIATAFVPPDYAGVGTQLGFRVRDKDEPASVVALPFYKRDS